MNTNRTPCDCKKAEPVSDNHGRWRCKWCGRPGKWTKTDKFHHRRGYRRVHADPRKETSN